MITAAQPFQNQCKQLSSEMQHLASQLPEVLEKSRAPATTRKYKAAFNRWSDWAVDQDVPPMPADPLHVALYLVKLINSSNSPAPVSAAVHGISWNHSIHGHEDPCQHNIVLNVHQAVKRTLCTPRLRKEPLSQKLLTKLYNCLSSGTLQDHQTLTLICVGFAGFMRWDDLTHIYADEIVIQKEYMAISLESRKNDQFREGSRIFVSRWAGDLCPVKLVEGLLARGRHAGHVQLFGTIRRTKQGEKIQGAMSYSRARELLREVLQKIGEDPDKFGLHSLRSGGVSAAAMTGVPDRLIQRQGGWKSEAGMKCYFSESLPKLLQVSKAIMPS